MRRILGLAVAILLGLPAVAAAEDVVVVELYTSQGCSSCPPADALLAEISKRPDIIALALHVDYWDYIGWKDEMAHPAFTARQKNYARAAGHRSVYTPQMIVGGRDHVTGYEPMKLADLIQKHHDAPNPVALTVRRDGDRIEVSARAVGRVDGPVVVQVARYVPRIQVAIHRGENAGRTIDYHNVVDLWSEIGRWNGRGDYSVTARVPGSDPVAVIVQADGNGPILAAARAR